MAAIKPERRKKNKAQSHGYCGAAAGALVGAPIFFLIPSICRCSAPGSGETFWAP
jgi:hypothetical protein